jgi:hypothetical protein
MAKDKLNLLSKLEKCHHKHLETILTSFPVRKALKLTSFSRSPIECLFYKATYRMFCTQQLLRNLKSSTLVGKTWVNTYVDLNG